MKTYKKAALGAVLGLALASPAMAVPITAGSQINILGGAAAIGAATVDAATGLDFLHDGAQGIGTRGTIGVDGGSTLSFAGFTAAGCPAAPSAGGCGSIADLPNFTSVTPITDFYDITEGGSTLSFDLSTLSVTQRIAGSAYNLPTLVLSGTGVFHLTGYDATPGVFTLTTQGGQVTTFSASTIAGGGGSGGGPSSVPEPASVALLGMGLLGLGFAARRRAG